MRSISHLAFTVLPLLASGQTIETEYEGLLPYLLNEPIWVVIAVVMFGVVIAIVFTWIMFTYSICRIRNNHRKFVESLMRNYRNRLARRRVQANSPRTPASNSSDDRRDALPSAISYRPNRRVPAQVYVSLAQLTAMAEGLQAQDQTRRENSSRGHVVEVVNEEQNDTPSAPPLPGSPPNYYELVQEQEREAFLAKMSRHHQTQVSEPA